METVAAVLAVLAVGGWIAVRETRQRIRRILDEIGQDGSRDTTPGDSGGPHDPSA